MLSSLKKQQIKMSYETGDQVKNKLALQECLFWILKLFILRNAKIFLQRALGTFETCLL